MPQGTIEAAKAVIAEAKKTNVAQYAQEEFRQAESALQSAIDQLAKQNKFEAMTFALRAKERAEVALRKARAQQPPAQSPTPATPVVGTSVKPEASPSPTPTAAPSKARKEKKGKTNTPR